MTPNVKGIAAYLCLALGTLIGSFPPPLSGRTILSTVLIVTGGVLLLRVVGTTHERHRPDA